MTEQSKAFEIIKTCACDLDEFDRVMEYLEDIHQHHWTAPDGKHVLRFERFEPAVGAWYKAAHYYLANTDTFRIHEWIVKLCIRFKESYRGKPPAEVTCPVAGVATIEARKVPGGFVRVRFVDCHHPLGEYITCQEDDVSVTPIGSHFREFAEMIITDFLEAPAAKLTVDSGERRLNEDPTQSSAVAERPERSNNTAARQRGPTRRTRDRAALFKETKDQHPTWSQARVVMEVNRHEHTDYTVDTLRNAYTAMGWKWERGDRIR